MQTANFWQIGGLLILLCTCGRPLIVPTGLVSLLHYIYSRIPIINKGTDSRLGVGFRFGPHADLQFLVELGPQQYTQSLGDPQNPAPCCGYEPPGVRDVSNQLTVRSSAVRGLDVHSSGSNSNGGGGGGGGRGDERKARSGATDWLGRWQAGVKGRAMKSYQGKTENVGSTKKASKPRSVPPLFTALHRFRDLWVAGRKAATTIH